MSQTVAIVGGGVVGLSTALYAARRGHRVVVVERDAATRFTTSFGNAGLITPSHVVPLAAPGVVAQGLKWMGDPESPFYVRPRLDPELVRWGWHFWRSGTAAHVARSVPVLRDLNLRSRQLYADLAAERDDFGLQLAGCLMLCDTAEGLDHEVAAAETARDAGLHAEVLDASGVAALEPGLTLSVAGGVLYPEDGFLDPGAFMASLADRATSAGAEIRWETTATGWRTEGDRVVALETAAGSLEADAFVVAGGAWTPNVIKSLGVRLPLQAGKGYHLHLAAPPERPRHSLILVEGRVAVTPMNGNVRLAGTMEIAGLGTAINPARLRGIVKAVPRYLPAFAGLDPAALPTWTGHRPCSPDGLPYVGRVGRWANLVAATGHAMMGLSLGPVTGEIVAALVSGEAHPLATSALDPGRFSGRATTQNRPGVV